MKKIVENILIALSVIMLLGCVSMFVWAASDRVKAKTRLVERIAVLEQKCDSLQRQIDFMVE